MAFLVLTVLRFTVTKVDSIGLLVELDADGLEKISP